MVFHLSLSAFLIIINCLKLGNSVRKNVILPLSFIVLFIYWALRYEYGQDYWQYNTIFYREQSLLLYGTGDILFFLFMKLFNHYYQLIIGQSAFVMITLFFFVRKYIPEKSYWLFLLLFLASPSVHFSLVSALRSSMAACVVYWAFSLCIIDKSRPFYFILLILIASLFHTSSIIFIIYPLINKCFKKFNIELFLGILFVFNIFAMFDGSHFFHEITSSIPFLEYYDHYSERIRNVGFGDFILRNINFIPLLFLYKYYKKTTDERFRNAYIITLFFFTIFFLNMDFHGRYSAYLFIFFIMALCIAYDKMKKKEKITMLTPYLVQVFYYLGLFYNEVFSNAYLYVDGNFDVYKTIFEASSLP